MSQLQNRGFFLPTPPFRRTVNALHIHRADRLGRIEVGGLAGRAARRAAAAQGGAICAVWEEY